jgi:hypothetical protein
MDWPHDPDGEQGSEGGRQYGHAVIAKKVDEEADFPLDRESFLEEYGADPVRLDYETVVSVADIFEYVEEDSFSDIVDMHQALGRAMRRGDFWFYEGAEQFTRTR